MSDPTPAHRAYCMVPLFLPTVSRDKLALEMPDGIIAFRKATSAPALLVKLSLEGEVIHALMPLHAARMMAEVLAELLGEKARVAAEPAQPEPPAPDDLVLASVDAEGRIVAWTRFHRDDPAFVGKTLIDQGGEGRTLRLMTSDSVCAALAAEAAA